MLRDEVGLALSHLRKLLLQRVRNILMNLAPAAQQQRLVRRILDQGMPESVGSVLARAARQHDLRADEALQSGIDDLSRLRCDNAQKIGAELASDNRSNLGDLLRFGAKPVEACQQRSLQRLGDLSVAAGTAGLDDRPRQLLDIERHAVRAAQDAR